MSVCGELNKTFTVRKHVKNDVNICATTHYETAYDDEGEYGPGPETRSEPQFFLQAKCRRGPSPRMGLSSNFTRSLNKSFQSRGSVYRKHEPAVIGKELLSVLPVST